MSVALDQIALLESVLNAKFQQERLSFKMSVHFVKDRMNDRRNNPAITFTELQSIFNRLTTIYISKLIRLKNNDTFNIRCNKTDINIPCGVELFIDSTGRDRRQIIAITVMRKKNFKSKDSLEFLI